MNYGDSAVKLARVASGKSQEKTAAVLNISLPTYAARERLPRSFSVEDLVEQKIPSTIKAKRSSMISSRKFFCSRM